MSLLFTGRPRFMEPRSPNMTIVLENDDVQLTCRGTGFPQPRTIWRRKIGGSSFHVVKNSPRFHVTTDGSLTILNARPEDETDYSCEIRNSHSYRNDLTIKLHVNGNEVFSLRDYDFLGHLCA